MTIKKRRGPIRQGWVELNRIETGSFFQSSINIAPGPTHQNKQKDNIQSQERLKQDRDKCIQAYLFNRSRTSTERKNHFKLSSMTQTEEKLLVRVHTLMTYQVTLVMLLAIISSKIYSLLSTQTVIIGMMIQAPLLTEPIWTGMMLHSRIDNYCERQMKMRTEEKENLQQMNQTEQMVDPKHLANQHKPRHNHHQDLPKQ